MTGISIGRHRQDFAAMMAIEEARRTNLARIFDSTLLVPSPGFVTTHLKSIAGGLNETLKEILGATPLAGTLDAIGDQIVDLLMGLLSDLEVVGEFLLHIGEELLGSVVAVLAEATPYLGIATSGIATIKAMFGVAKECGKRLQLYLAQKHFHAETALAAVKAFEDLVERQIAGNGLDLARNAASTGLKVGGCFLDFGTATTVAVGVANAVAGLIKAITMAALEFLDMRNGNKFLRNPGTISKDMFAKCPILGCYYLVLADTSDLVNFLATNIGAPNWKADVEKLAKSCDKIRTKAEKTIMSSRYILISTKDTIPLPVVTRVYYQSKSAKIREQIRRRVLSPITGITGSHRDQQMLKGKIIFEVKRKLSPEKVLQATQKQNFQNSVAASLPKS